ncbi:Ubiquitin carboxyl-terminal hydrolase 16 [Halotydeus destructor]|nr:Ubiquitin carboxyl-terminal hydrolase 16 [Halotydeus destructor]
MGRKKNGSRSTQIRQKAANDDRKRKERTQTSQRRRTSSSSDQSNHFFEGLGRVNLDERPSQRSLIGNVIANNKPGAIKRPKGLTNLGNTCYYNSVMQVLSQTPLLRECLDKILPTGVSWTALHSSSLHDHLKSAAEGEKEPLVTALDEPLPLTIACTKFLREMQSDGGNHNVTPTTFLSEVGRKCPQFRGRDQQDSHELLRNLLDVLKTDEVRRHRLAIISSLNIDRKNTSNVDDDTKALVKGYGHFGNFTVMDQLFGGYMLSSVRCEECEASSEILEPFFDLSLPVSEGKQKHDHSISSKRKGKKEIEEEEPEKEEVSLLDVDARKLDVKGRREKRNQKKAAKRTEKLARSRKAKSPQNDANMGGDGVSDVPEEDVQLEHGNESGKEEFHSDAEHDSKVNSDNESSSTRVGRLIQGAANILSGRDDSEVQSIDIKAENLADNESPNEMADLSVPDSGVCDADSEDDGMSDKRDLDDSDAIAEQVHRISMDEDALHGFNDEPGSRIRTISCTNDDLKEKKKRCLTAISPKPEQSFLDGTPTLESCLSAYTLPEILTGNNKLFCEKCTEASKKKGVDQKVYTNASKQILIAYPPPVLTLHLKRFQAEGYRVISLRKINRFVSFPAILDLSAWTSPMYKVLGHEMGVQEMDLLKYEVYGIVQHSGSLRSGHYTAFVKLRKHDDNLKKIIRLKPFISNVEKLLENVSLDDLSNPLTDEEKSLDVEKSTGSWFHISDSHVAAASEQSALNAQAYILLYERKVL